MKPIVNKAWASRVVISKNIASGGSLPQKRKKRGYQQPKSACINNKKEAHEISIEVLPFELRKTKTPRKWCLTKDCQTSSLSSASMFSCSVYGHLSLAANALAQSLLYDFKTVFLFGAFFALAKWSKLLRFYDNLENINFNLQSTNIEFSKQLVDYQTQTCHNRTMPLTAFS